MGKNKHIKTNIKEMKKNEKRKKAIIKILSSDKIPKGMTQGDLYATVRGYNHLMLQYRKNLNSLGYKKAVTKDEKKLEKSTGIKREDV